MPEKLAARTTHAKRFPNIFSTSTRFFHTQINITTTTVNNSDHKTSENSLLNQYFINETISRWKIDPIPKIPTPHPDLQFGKLTHMIIQEKGGVFSIRYAEKCTCFPPERETFFRRAKWELVIEFPGLFRTPTRSEGRKTFSTTRGI